MNGFIDLGDDTGFSLICIFLKSIVIDNDHHADALARRAMPFVDWDREIADYRALTPERLLPAPRPLVPFIT